VSALAYRKKYRLERIGPRYRGWAHLAFTSLGSLAAIGFALSRLEGVRAAELLTVPLALAGTNLGEYLGHRGPLHRPHRGLRVLFERHALQHHSFFTHEAMAAETSRDFHMVLFPPVMLVFFLGALAAPGAAALHRLVAPNVGWLFAATATAHFLAYEWLHLAYHLDERSRVGRLPLVGRLRRLHAAHHDPRLMGRRNFNVTLPLGDWLFGTLERRPLRPAPARSNLS
jgi:hypothetical protein